MAVNKWRPLIGGSEILIFTDNKNLLGKTSDFSKRANRWRVSISDLNIHFNHIQSKENVIADELSRNNIHQVSQNNTLNLISQSNTFGPLDLKKYFFQFHIINGHPGYSSSYLTLRKIMNILKNVKILLSNIIKTCHFCQIIKKTIEYMEIISV
ncbi:Transposon Tf2-11 polyprotein [Dictyocoela muelleri]|nr:Transposon Tf2-11 polyprotein [Dictyocoela muelleri]